MQNKILLVIINLALMPLALQSMPAVAADVSETASARVQLQVLATTIKVHVEPNSDALVLYEIAKASLLDVIEQRGDWFKIKINSLQEFGWVHQEPWEYGELTLSVLPDKGEVRYSHEAIGTLAPEDAPQTNKFQPAKPNFIATLPPIDSAQVAPPSPNLPRETVPILDRWRIMQALDYKFPWYDPYNQNHLKGDLPVLKEWGDHLFFNLGVISDTVFESRKVATPVAGQTSIRPSANNTYGNGEQFGFNQNIILSFSLSKGDTTFKPPDYEFKFVPVINYNYADVQEAGILNADPRKGTTRSDSFVGVQELFIDYHLRNVSDRYDFDSMRVGIQPFISDFRGFLFQDTPFGVRIFGTRDNNRYQYNLAWFRRIEKDTNSGLNDVGQRLRDDDIFAANLYLQDFPQKGFTSQVSLIHNRNSETDRHYNKNGFLVRPALLGDLQPHKYNVNYLGYSGDGHFGKWNLTTSTYLAIGSDSRNPIAQKSQDIFAAFHASELSFDFDWLRVRGNLLLASGDKDPYDDKATGFDAILENPQFAGASTSYYIRQAIPLVGGGGVELSGRNGILPSLRSSSIQGQSNFVNPGLFLLGIGADVDLTPQLRVFGNITDLSFMNTSSLGAMLNEAPPPKHIGVDASVGMHWRPFFNQNVIVNGSIGALFPGGAIKQMYGNDQGTLYSGLLNILLTY